MFDLKKIIILAVLGGGGVVGANQLLQPNSSPDIPQISSPDSPSGDIVFNNVKEVINKMMPYLEKAYNKGSDCAKKVNIDAIIGNNLQNKSDENFAVLVNRSIKQIIAELEKCR